MRFYKEQETSWLLSSLESKPPKSPLTGEVVNKFLLAGDKIMPEMHLRQLGFIYSTCGPFIKERNRRFNIYLSKWTR